MSGEIFSSEKIDWLWRIMLAQGFIILTLLLSLASFSIPYTDSIRPFFILIPIYYWVIYRPSLVSPLLLFIYGLIIDLISGFPLGLNAGLFVAVYWVIKSQRLFLMGQPYPVFWTGFGLVSSSVFLVQWLVFSFKNMQAMPIIENVASNIITIILFPIMALVLAYIQKILPHPPKVH